MRNEGNREVNEVNREVNEVNHEGNEGNREGNEGNLGRIIKAISFKPIEQTKRTN